MTKKTTKAKKKLARKKGASTSKRSAAQKRSLFIEAYCSNGGNATQAAISAGYSKKTARSQGCALLTYPDIAEAVAKRSAEVLAAAQEKTQLTADEILASLARDIRFDPAKLYREDGSLKSIHEMDEDTRLALRGLEIQHIASMDAKVIKAKFPEKTSAREQGMKHFGLYEADNKQQLPPNITFEIVSGK